MQGLTFSIIPTQSDALCFRITPMQGLSFFRVDTGPIFSIIPTQGDALCYRIMPMQGLSFFRVHAGLNLFYYSNTGRGPMLSHYALSGLLLYRGSGSFFMK